MNVTEETSWCEDKYLSNILRSGVPRRPLWISQDCKMRGQPWGKLRNRALGGRKNQEQRP